MSLSEPKETWVERHINWSMALAWFIIGALSFALLFTVESETGETLLAIYGSLALLGLLTGAWGLQAKGQSLTWLFFFLIPLGFAVLFILGNKRTRIPQSSIAA